MFYRLKTSDSATTLRSAKWAAFTSYMAGDAVAEKIVRAKNEDEARQVASLGCSVEGREAWLDPTTTVELLPEDGPAECFS